MFYLEMFGAQSEEWRQMGLSSGMNFNTACYILKDYERLYPEDQFRIVCYTDKEEK